MRHLFLALLVVGSVLTAEATAQTHVSHLATIAAPPGPVVITEYEVMQQCCLANGPVLELAGPVGIVFARGFLWFTENQGYVKRSADPNTEDPGALLEFEAIGRMDLRGRYTRVLFDHGAQNPAERRSPHLLVSGPNNKVYFTEARGDRIGSFTPSNGRVPIHEESVGRVNAAPAPITLGPDGAPWFGENGFNFAENPPAGDLIGRIVRFDPQRKEVDRTFVSGSFSFPTDMTRDAQSNIWFTEFVLGNVARLSFDANGNGMFTRFGGADGPSGIVLGPDGHIWFTERSGSRVVCLTSAGIMHHYDLGTIGGVSKEPARIIVGPSSTLWFTQVAGNRLGQFAPACGSSTIVVTEYPLPAYVARHAHPEDDVQTDFPPSASRNPFGLVYVPDDNAIWFTETRTSSIGRLDLGP